MADTSLWSEDDPRTRLAELTADTSDPAKEHPLRRDVRSLDILLEVPRLIVPGTKSAANPKATAPVRLQITGTIENPVVTEIKGQKNK